MTQTAQNESDPVSVLYTREILGKAMELAAYPVTDDFTAKADLQSRTCGSSISLAITIDDRDRISAVGVKSHACALGQASAAIFAAHAVGRDLDEVQSAMDDFAGFLTGDRANGGDWPDIDMLAPAQPYSARHESLLLPFRAAAKILSEAKSKRD